MKSLNNISRAQEAFRREQLPGEMPPQMHPFVMAITRNPGAIQDEIGADICISKSMVSRRIEWLLERGYVRREADSEDKRCLRIYPTEKMLEIYGEVRRISRKWIESLTEFVSEDELALFEDVLHRLEARAREVAHL